MNAFWEWRRLAKASVNARWWAHSKLCTLTRIRSLRFFSEWKQVCIHAKHTAVCEKLEEEVNSRKVISVKMESMQQEKESLQTMLESQIARFTELGAELTQRACQGTAAQMFERVFKIDTVSSDCNLPARCGHLMLSLSQQKADGQYAICIGGIEGEDWQSTCFGVVIRKEEFAANELRMHTCAVHSNVQDPLGLCESAACVLADQSVFLCGGRNGGEEQKCIWIGQPAVLEKGNDQACRSEEACINVTWQEVNDTSALFDARCQHSVSYYAARDCVIVFGGYNVRKKHLSDVWVMDLGARSLWQASDQGELPKARRGQVAHIIGDHLWIFGGACDTGVLGDLARLCLSTWAWQQVEPVGQKPCARRAAASCSVGDRWLVVHGGFDGANCLSDAFVLDTHTLVWSRIETNGQRCSAGALGPRALHAMCPLGHGLLVYGGACSNTVLDSCFLLHNSSLTQGHKLQCALHSAELNAAAFERQVAERTAERDAYRRQLQSELDERKVMHQSMEVLNERLRSAVSNSQILANKLAQERQANKDLDQQLLEQHQATERAQHNCMRLEHELQGTQHKLATVSVQLEEHLESVQKVTGT